MKKEDPFEIYADRAKRNKRILIVLDVLAWLIFISFWLSYAIWRFDEKYLIIGAFLTIPLGFRMSLQRYLNNQKMKDEYDKNRDEEIYAPIKNSLSNQREEKTKEAIIEKPAIFEVHHEITTKLTDFNRISIHGYYRIPYWKYASAVFLPYMIAFGISIDRDSGSFRPPIAVVIFVFIATIISAGLISFYIWKKRYRITIENGSVRLSNGSCFEIDDVENILIREPIATKDFRISYSKIFYKLGHSRRSTVIFRDIENYDELVDLFIKAS